MSDTLAERPRRFHVGFDVEEVENGFLLGSYDIGRDERRMKAALNVDQFAALFDEWAAETRAKLVAAAVERTSARKRAAN